MSAKLIVKNLNVKTLAKDFVHEFNEFDLNSNTENLIETIRSSFKLTNQELGKFSLNKNKNSEKFNKKNRFNE
jgi:hypothetical protein